MSYWWLLHYGYELISKHLEISRKTVVNGRDFVGILPAMSETQAFLLVLRLFIR